MSSIVAFVVEKEVVKVSTPGLQGAPGKSAYQSAVDLGFEGTEEEWLASIGGTPGEVIEGKSAYQSAVDLGFVGTEVEWIESLHGQDGDTPVKGVDYDDGADGDSAYQIWLAAGNTGTEADFLDSLHGQDGQDGTIITVSATAPESPAEGDLWLDIS